MKIGNLHITNPKIGTTPINKVFIGVDQVYPNYNCIILENEFIFQINTNLGNGLTSYNYQPPTSGTINYNIDWGDSSSNTVTTSTGLTHSYSSHGIYTIKVLITSGITSPNLRFGADKEKVIDILDWGTYNGWTSLQSMFYTMNSLPSVLSVNTSLDCTNVSLVRNMLWNTSVNSLNIGCFKNLTNMLELFQLSTGFNDLSIENLNTSLVTNMTRAFNATGLNFDVSLYDISVVINGTDCFKSSALSDFNYQLLLINWTGWNGTTPTKTLQSSVPFHFGTAKYEIGGQSEDVRNYLINTLGWTITDGGGI
jgi:hypothetical protein